MPLADPPAADVERTLAYLRIALLPGLGVPATARLLRLAGDPRGVAALSAGDLAAAGIREEIRGRLLSEGSLDDARREWHRAMDAGIRIVDLPHPDYPRLLREIPDPPPVLYVRGRAWNLDRPHIAVVGSRKPSRYGTDCATRIGCDLASAGVTVVSGMARGIDTAAHRGALASGTTLAVLGTGLDRVYPAENAALAAEIAERGALASEFPLGTPPLPGNFPRRNRVLAGLTLGTLVVEATLRSGSLITARLACESNREVFAVPGPIHSPKSRGCHQLIRDGACLVTGWEDIARELSPAVALEPAPGAPRQHSPEARSPREAQVLDALPPSEEVAVDVLLSRTRIAAPELYAVLLDLELGGAIRRLAGDRYARRIPVPPP